MHILFDVVDLAPCIASEECSLFPMFLTGFILALVLCLPVCVGNGMLSAWGSWSEVISWPILSGLLILLILRIATFSRWQREAKEAWFGGLLGAIIGSGVLWGLQVWG